jgi:hypothetical protein
VFTAKTRKSGKVKLIVADVRHHENKLERVCTVHAWKCQKHIHF